MKLKLLNESPLQIESECLVIGISAGGPLSRSAQSLDEASGGGISKMLDSGDIETGLGKTILLHGFKGTSARRVLITGLGKAEKLDPPRYDRACLAAGGYVA